MEINLEFTREEKLKNGGSKLFEKLINFFKRKNKKEKVMKGAWRYKKDGITKEYL